MKRFDSTDSIVSNVRGNVSAFAKPAMPWSCAKLLLQATNQQQQRERKSKTAKKKILIQLRSMWTDVRRSGSSTYMSRNRYVEMGNSKYLKWRIA